MGTIQRSLVLFASILATVGLLAAGCGTSEAGDASAGSSSDGVEISGAWARTSPAMASAGAAYLEITSSADDRLVSATVDSSIAGRVEIHETVAMESGGDGMEGDGMEGDGMATDMPMMMHELEAGLELPAGEVVSLKPGGYHVMLLDLPAPLESGSTFDLALQFEDAGTKTVSVEVRDNAQ